MKYKDFYQHLLLESMEKLFHLTNVNALLSMLKENRILLSFSGDSPSDASINHGKFFYLSTSREKYSGYARGTVSGKYVTQNVNLVLNGRAIENTRGMKLKSVDYWGKEMGDLRKDSNETEERIISDSHQISPLEKYVTEIHIYCGEEINGYMKSNYNSILESIKKYRIPVFFYFGDSQQIKQAYKLHAKKYSINAEEFGKVLNDKFSDIQSEDPSKINWSDKEKVNTILDIARNPEKYIDYTKVSKDASRYISTMEGQDSSTLLSNLNKNRVRDELYELSKEVRKQGFNNFNKFISALGDKMRTLQGIHMDIGYYNKDKDFSSFFKQMVYRLKIKKENLSELESYIKSRIDNSGKYPHSEKEVIDLYNKYIK